MPPDFFVVAAFVSVFAIIAALSSRGLRKNSNEATRRSQTLWKAAAHRLGLSQKTDGDAIELAGVRDGFAVRIERLRTSNDAPLFSARLVINGGSAWPEDLRISGGAPRFESGDLTFDGVVQIDARDRRELRAILDANVRRRIYLALGDAFSLTKNQIFWERQDPTSADELVSWVNDGIELARRLRRPAEDSARRLQEIVEKDRIVAVRVGALKQLDEAHAGTAEHIAAARSAARDSDPELRLPGAIALGAEGLETLIETLIKAPNVRPSFRAAALDAAVRVDRDRVLREKAMLLDLLWAKGAPAIAAAQAIGFAEPGDARFEGALIAQLADDDSSLKVAVATSLGRIGTIAAVAPLLELTKVLFANEVSKAAENAIEMIQARAGGEKGALSLSEGGGELSLAAGESGGLAIADEE